MMQNMEKMETVLQKIAELQKKQKRVLVAIDGRCASGKSTFAEKLAEAADATLLHMDDFFLRPVQRTAERYAEPGGNVDRERFQEEVLDQIRDHDVIHYQPFDCATMTLTEGYYLVLQDVIIVEGSYSLHPALRDAYDLKIFLHVDPERQLERIAVRNPDKVEDFRTKWIPYEEKYFATCRPEDCADLRMDTTEWF